MRQKALTLVVAALIVLVASVAFAGPSSVVQAEAARTEAAVLPPAVPASSSNPMPRPFDDLRDCAALVLVGGMLIGLAAAVRRTA